MKKFTLKTKHLKLHHIINLGLMRHWMDFLLHFYRLNICLRGSLFRLSQKLSYPAYSSSSEGTELKDTLRKQDRPLGNHFNSWKLILNKKKHPDEAAWERTYGLATWFLKKISFHAVALRKVTFYFLKRHQVPVDDWLTKSTKHSITEAEENSCTSTFTQ